MRRRWLVWIIVLLAAAAPLDARLLAMPRSLRALHASTLGNDTYGALQNAAPHLFAGCPCEAGSTPDKCCVDPPGLNLMCHCEWADATKKSCSKITYMCSSPSMSSGTSIMRNCNGGAYNPATVPDAAKCTSPVCTNPAIPCPSPSTTCQQSGASDYKCVCAAGYAETAGRGPYDACSDPCSAAGKPCNTDAGQKCTKGVCICPDGSEENCLKNINQGPSTKSQANKTIIIVCVVIGTVVLAGVAFVVYRNVTETGSTRKTLAWGREGRATYAGGEVGSSASDKAGGASSSSSSAHHKDKLHKHKHKSKNAHSDTTHGGGGGDGGNHCDGGGGGGGAEMAAYNPPNMGRGSPRGRGRCAPPSPRPMRGGPRGRGSFRGMPPSQC